MGLSGSRVLIEQDESAAACGFLALVALVATGCVESNQRGGLIGKKVWPLSAVAT